MKTKSEEEEIIIQNPPKKPKVLGIFPATSDAHLVLRKASTHLALASASATAGLGAFALMPARAQALVPDWALGALGAVALVSALLIPLATSIKQQGLKP